MRTSLGVILMLSLAATDRARADDLLTGVPDAATLDSIVTVAPPAEPGQRMIVTGRLYAPDRRTPLAGRRIGVYQTDAKGDYGRDPARPRWARLHGWLKTGSLGSYEIRTIRPGGYREGNTPQHIHFVIETPTGSDGVTELQFQDDRRVPPDISQAARHDGRFGLVRPVTRTRDGVLHVERDLLAR